MMPRLTPIAQKRWQRFKNTRRGFWSALILMSLILLACGAELIANQRALIVSYEGELYFPTYGDVLPGTTFGKDYAWETEYKKLAKEFAEADSDNWVLMPPVPWGPYEVDVVPGDFPPHSPSLSRGHILGTDTAGRDVFARLLYGFRIAIFFSLFLLLCEYVIGVIIGMLMGFWGGAFDLLFQRLIEIWSNVPFLYVVIIIASVITPSFWILAAIMVAFGWTNITWYMRTATYKEAARDYVLAARAIGASNPRILFNHILPNSLYILVTFMPFSVASGISALTALDYLGFGLPPPTPSWGELLKQGTDNLESLWIVSSVVITLSLVLLMVTWIGEAVRDAFDPKQVSWYE